MTKRIQVGTILTEQRKGRSEIRWEVIALAAGRATLKVPGRTRTVTTRILFNSVVWAGSWV